MSEAEEWDDGGESAKQQSKDGAHTKRETKYDAEGNMDKYKEWVQKSMEKPYPENGGFYGVGALREMGLRKSRHSGDWRTKSAFQNKEEEFVQPINGPGTVLERGLPIRGAGGLRKPGAKTGDGVNGAFQEPPGGKASTAANVELIRSLGKSLSMPKSVQERRTFEEELAELDNPNDFPEWAIRFAFKLFRTYTTPFPSYSYGLARSASTMGSPAASARSSVSSTRSSRKSAPVMASTLALKIEIIRGKEMPQMDATGIDDTEGCDAYVVLRYDGEERYRSSVVQESYTPEWNCTHVLPIPRLSQSLPLIVQVWDADEVHDELIGQTSLNFVSMVCGKREERWLTITAEGYKAFQSVQQKTDNTNAGQVLVALTLDFAHKLAIYEQVQEEEEDTQIRHEWGIETTSVDANFDIGRTPLTTASVRQLLATRLEQIRDGINVAVKRNLHGAVNSLIKACHYQLAGELFDSRLLVEEANRFADKELRMLHNDIEDRLLAAKVAMACIAMKYSNNLRTTSEECKKHLFRVMSVPEIVAAVDDELLASDPDHKYLRESNASHCCCTENQPGARVFRHRLLHDVRNLTLSAKEELLMATLPSGAPNLNRTGREATKYPGPIGREVDNCLELLSCSSAITLRAHAQSVTALCVSGDWLFSASSDKTIRVWSLTTCECIRLLDLEHNDNINCLAASPGRWDMQLFSGAENIKSYNITHKFLSKDTRLECNHTLPHHKGPVTCMATALFVPESEADASRKGWRLYTGSVDRKIHVYETAFIGARGIHPDDPQPIAVLEGHKSTVTTLAVSRHRIFSGSYDTTIMMWSNIDFTALKSLSMGGDIINNFCLVGARLYVASSDREIVGYDMENLAQVCKLTGHHAYVYALASSTSRLTLDVSTQIQDENPMFDMQQRKAQPLTFSSYKNGV